MHSLTAADPSQVIRTVESSTTSSDEVLATAQAWIKQCSCANDWEERGQRWYPRRLLDLNELCKAGSNMDRAKVRLVDSTDCLQNTVTIGPKDVSRNVNDRYITLSHCWGQPCRGAAPLKLTSMTLERFTNDGISLEELPKTFRDTMLFACRLNKVRFVWIDSLCIRQPIKDQGYDEEEQLSDWIEQSRSMDKVYQNAYLNISATASHNSHEGLFRDRIPEYIQAELVEVSRPNNQLAARKNLTQCKIRSVSAWEEMVTKAPVHRRGWVVQERFLASRVLHFCQDQIAWECYEFRDAECLGSSIWTFRPEVRGSLPVDRVGRLSTEVGKRLRDTRLDGLTDPDSGMQDLYTYELWSKVVETYSLTEVSYSSDKLVGLSGLASHFHRYRFTASEGRTYLAGLWSTHLESQLLWQVNEVFEHGRFINRAKRITGRAPSWSWASLDTPDGIEYSDVTDYGAALVARETSTAEDEMERSIPDEELFCNVVDYNIVLMDAKSPFGMVKGGYILVKTRHLHRIVLRKLSEERSVPYAWWLKPASHMEQPDWEHTDMNLDAPDSDTDIFQDSSELLVMPVAHGPRVVRKIDRYLFCLLLRFEGIHTLGELYGTLTTESHNSYRSFTRIGITKLPLDTEREREALQTAEIEEVICLL